MVVSFTVAAPFSIFVICFDRIAAPISSIAADSDRRRNPRLRERPEGHSDRRHFSATGG
jgi:hypothetical protein